MALLDPNELGYAKETCSRHMGSFQSGNIGGLAVMVAVNGRGKVMAVRDMQRNDGCDIG